MAWNPESGQVCHTRFGPGRLRLTCKCKHFLQSNEFKGLQPACKPLQSGHTAFPCYARL